MMGITPASTKALHSYCLIYSFEGSDEIGHRPLWMYRDRVGFFSINAATNDTNLLS